MRGGFHPAGAGGFERTARVVQPNIAATNHLAADMDVIVFNKNKAAIQLTKLAQVNDLLNECFPMVVARMGLAREDELDWSPFVFDQLHNLLELIENQRCPLVGGEAASEPDGQGVGVQESIKLNKVALMEGAALEEESAAGEFQ